MDKKERYINYIVSDLLKDTEIDYEEERINFPFPSSLFSFSSLPTIYPSFFYFSSFYHSFSSFTKYLKERYGAGDDETDIIFNLYEERIQSLIKK